MGLEKIGTLILVVAALTGMVHALIKGDLWAAGIVAFTGVVFFWTFRTDKRIQHRP
jgi:hypothetical protein